MDILDRKVREEIENSINSIGFELMEIECSPNSNGLKIVTFIDHLDGVTLDDCVKASKLIEPILDNENEEGTYLLEVSSPGLNRKLITKEHFDRFIGKTVKIKLKEKIDNRKNYKGELLIRHGNEIEVMVDNIKFTIDIDSIDICRIVPKFK
tara:strand:- start:299 stop:754 length:456 start_codon:yes stop_codon:yes gene_type:complete